MIKRLTFIAFALLHLHDWFALLRLHCWICIITSELLYLYYCVCIIAFALPLLNLHYFIVVCSLLQIFRNNPTGALKSYMLVLSGRNHLKGYSSVVDFYLILLTKGNYTKHSIVKPEKKLSVAVRVRPWGPGTCFCFSYKLPQSGVWKHINKIITGLMSLTSKQI